MASVNEGESLISGLSQDTQLELYMSWQTNQEETITKLVEIAKENGQKDYDAATVKRLIAEFTTGIEKDDENEDLELNSEELTAVAGGGMWMDHKRRNRKGRWARREDPHDAFKRRNGYK